MILVCPTCSSRLQAGGDKPPEHPFILRCPKCNSTVNSEPPSPASTHSALALGSSPATEKRRVDESEPAPLFRAAEAVSQTADQPSIEEVVRILGSVFGQGTMGVAPSGGGARPSWNPRKVLVCTAEPYRERVAHQLSEKGNQVFVAQDTRQAVERMRENHMDVVVLDQDFDPLEQGAAFVTREVSILRPAQRRRVFFVLLSQVLRTMETHAAFLHNVNAIVNIKDIDDMGKALEHSLRDYNELYKEFNVALNITAL